MAKLFPYTIINGESQTLLLRLLLRGGGGCTQAILYEKRDLFYTVRLTNHKPMIEYVPKTVEFIKKAGEFCYVWP